MRIAYNKIGQSNGKLFEVSTPVVRVGSDPDTNDIVLSSPFVAPRAAVLNRSGPHWEITTLGENDIFVDNQVIRVGERAIVFAQQAIRIYPFSLTLDGDTEALTGPSRLEQLDQHLAQLVLDVHRDLLDRMDVSDSDDARRESDSYLLKLESDIEEIARLRGFLDEALDALRLYSAGRAVQAGLLSRILEDNDAPRWGGDGRWTRLQTAVPDLETELDGLVSLLERQLKLSERADISDQMEQIETEYWSTWETNAERLHETPVSYNS